MRREPCSACHCEDVLHWRHDRGPIQRWNTALKVHKATPYPMSPRGYPEFP